MLHGGGRENYKNIIKIDGFDYKLSEKGLNSISLDILIYFLKKKLKNNTNRCKITYLDENNEEHTVEIDNNWRIRIKLTNMPLPSNHWAIGYFSYHKYISIVLVEPRPSTNEYLLLTIGAEEVLILEPVKLVYAVSIPDKISLKCLKSDTVNTVYDCKKKRFGYTRSKKKDFRIDDQAVLTKIIFFLILIKQLFIDSEGERQKLEPLKKELDSTSVQATVKRMRAEEDLKKGKDNKAVSNSELMTAVIDAAKEETAAQDAVTLLQEEIARDAPVTLYYDDNDPDRIESFIWNTGYLYGIKYRKEIRHKFPAKKRVLTCTDNCTPILYNCWHFAGILYKIFTSSNYLELDFSNHSSLENSLDNWNLVRTSRKEYCCIRQLIVNKGKLFSGDIIGLINP